MKDNALINNIRVLRAVHGWTQQDLAERVGVTRKTINTIENGKYTPSTHTAIRIARAFNVTVEDVFQLPE